MKINFSGFTIDYLTIFGLSAQFLFFLRFIYQWLISEKKKESVIPIEFWYFSISGGILITIYAFLRKDLVFFLGQILALFIYLRNLSLINKSKSVHQKKYQTVNFLKRFFIFLFLKKTASLIKEIKAKKILDIGCGEGQVINFLKKENSTLKFTGFDVSKEAVDRVKKILPEEKFSVANIYQVDKIFQNQGFDLVLILEVLEHLKQPDLALGKLKKLKTRYFLFSVPKEPWFSFGNFLMGKNITRLGRDKDHRWFWKREEFLDLLKQDFKIIKLINNPFWTIVLSGKQFINNLTI